MAIISMADASPPPREMRERLCPYCLSVDVVALGRVSADNTGLRSEYQCRDCSHAFVLLFVDRRAGPPERRGSPDSKREP